MKKKNFYKILVLALGTSFGATAQIDASFYKIDAIHNGDGGIGSISVLNLIVQKGSTLGLNLIKKPDSIFWMHYDYANPKTSYNSSDSIIKLKSDEVVRAYVLFDKQWYTQKDIYYILKDTATAKDTVNCIKYDQKGTGNLIAPIIKNGKYTWYFNDTLVSNTTHTLYPDKKGKYKVVIEWDDLANLRTEEIKSVTYEFVVTQLPLVTSIENTNSENAFNAIYPNPANNVVYLNAKGDFEYTIETANAELVTSGTAINSVQLDLRGMNTGMYFVRIKSNETQSVNKLIVR